jgi:putative Mg2+ transporter-C (MgtC) family protein
VESILLAMLLAHLSTAEIILRLFVATIVGCLLGLNREMLGKPAGLRTHALVSLGSALMAITVLGVQGDAPGEGFSRVMQGVITGIGFLGAGVILRDVSGKITGLTTAAMIWIAAVLGLASGAGRWIEVSVATVLIFFVLLLERWEHKLRFTIPIPQDSGTGKENGKENGHGDGNGNHAP